MAKGPNFSTAFQGRTFFFFGKTAKKMEDLPDLDPRSYILCPGSRPLKDLDQVSSPATRKAVEDAYLALKEKGDFKDD